MKALAALTLALATVGSIATATAVLPYAGPDTPSGVPLPAEQQVNGIAYMNDGAGLDDVAYLKTRAREFPLQIIFSGRGGEWGVADSVTIFKDGRELLSVPNAGPYFMLKLPPGRYTMEATFKGVVEKRSATVGAGITKVNWNTVRASD